MCLSKILLALFSLMPFHGVDMSFPAQETEIDTVAAHDVKVVRQFIMVDLGLVDSWGWPEYKASLDEGLRFLDYNCELYTERNIKTIVTLAAPPGGSYNAIRFGSYELSMFLETWRVIAEKYAHSDCIYGFDLMNEPNISAVRLNQIQQLTLQVVRWYTDKPVIFTTRYGHCHRFGDMQAVSDPNVLYTCHEYQPPQFTHQGVYYKAGVKYPGSRYNKKDLEKDLKPVRRFADKHGAAKIFIGEGAVSIFTELTSRIRYAADLFNLTNDYNWTYFFSGSPYGPSNPNVWELDDNIWREYSKHNPVQ